MILGSLIGGLFRIVPEAMKMLDRKSERKHELDLFQKQLQADQLKAQQNLNQIREQNSGQLNIAEVAALVEGVKAQGQITGVKWVDAVSSLMRPLITFWWVIVLYSIALFAQYHTLVQAGDGFISSVLQLWGPEEKEIVSSIISFWFVDRSLRKK